MRLTENHKNRVFVEEEFGERNGRLHTPRERYYVILYIGRDQKVVVMRLMHVYELPKTKFWVMINEVIVITLFKVHRRGNFRITSSSEIFERVVRSGFDER